MSGKQVTMFRHIMSETYRVLLVSHESCSLAFSLSLSHPHLVVDTEINVMAVIEKLGTCQMPVTDPFIYSTFTGHGFLSASSVIFGCVPYFHFIGHLRIL